MRFTLLATALFATALAAPAPQTAPDPNTYENIDIADLSVRTNADGAPLSVYFKLTGKDATDLECQSTLATPELPSEVVTCGDSKYRFALVNGTTYQFGLRIYHELGLAAGFYGEGDVFTYCHAGGAGVQACNQVNPTTIVIDANPAPQQ